MTFMLLPTDKDPADKEENIMVDLYTKTAVMQSTPAVCGGGGGGGEVTLMKPASRSLSCLARCMFAVCMLRISATRRWLLVRTACSSWPEAFLSVSSAWTYAVQVSGQIGCR